MANQTLQTLERLIRTDPARRGLIATEAEFGPLLSGHLALAAEELAAHATCVGIVTGFFIPTAEPPAAETDGPLGAALLAATFRQVGIEAFLITDCACEAALRLAASQLQLPEDCVRIWQDSDTQSSYDSCFDKLCGDRCTHLIAIERAGPSHTADSWSTSSAIDNDNIGEFHNLIILEDYDRCYNMRGVCIDEWTAPLHRLFETARSDGQIKTIGIGDGGNEIGMGSIPWWELARRLPEPHGAKIICRIPCDYTILAGVSNWGGYALAAAVAYLKGRVDVLTPRTCAQQWECLEQLVREGPAVDGVTRLPQPTVDGLPFATYIQPWDSMRQLLGLPR